MQTATRPWSRPGTATPKTSLKPQGNPTLSEFSLVFRGEKMDWERDVLEDAATLIAASGPDDSMAMIRPGIVISDWERFLTSIQHGLRLGPASASADRTVRDIRDGLALLRRCAPALQASGDEQ